MPGQARIAGGVASAATARRSRWTTRRRSRTAACCITGRRARDVAPAAGAVPHPNTNTTIIGTTANYLEVRTFTLAAGRMFTTADDDGRKRGRRRWRARPLADLGAPAARERSSATACASRGIQFDVVGVLVAKGRAARLREPRRSGAHPAQHGALSRRSARATCARSTCSRRAKQDIPHDDGRDRDASSAGRTASAPGRRRRFRHPQPVRLPRDARARPRRCSRLLLAGIAAVSAARRRHRHHEHHARVGHRAHARDRRAQGARRDAAQHPPAVPDRGGGALPARRPDRRRRSGVGAPSRCAIALHWTHRGEPLARS